MVNYGNGFTWYDVYTMPIHWRKFYYNKLVESKKKEQEQVQKTQKSAKGPGVRVRR